MRSTKTSCQTPSRKPIAASFGNATAARRRSRGVRADTGSSRRSSPSPTFDSAALATAMASYLRAQHLGDARDDVGGGQFVAGRRPVAVNRELFEHPPGA